MLHEESFLDLRYKKTVAEFDDAMECLGPVLTKGHGNIVAIVKKMSESTYKSK